MKQIKRKSLLYKSAVEYADFCINHVEGCAHGCKFPCYAMMMKKRCGVVKSYDDWLEPKLVSNALELLNKEIPKYKDNIKFVHLCFTTDPFMYKFPEVSALSLKIIERLNRDNIRCTVLTKGLLPKELKEISKYGANNEYGITLVSLEDSFREKFEPYSAPYFERIKALYHLHKAGVKTWLSMEPYPTPNLADQDLLDILESVSFADKIIFGKLNYNVESSKTGYKQSEEFYQNCANKVVSFCNDKGIDFHIKFGTAKKDNKSTDKLFRKIAVG